MLIRRIPNFEELPRHFQVRFRCNFDGGKIHVVFTYFLLLLTFFDVISMGKDIRSFLVSYKLMKTFEKVFPVFVTVNS